MRILSRAEMKQWVPWGKIYSKNGIASSAAELWRARNDAYGACINVRGQALLELAIFGSIIIMLIGILLNYGLRANFQQAALQKAFRKALAESVKSSDDNAPSSVSYVRTEDKHIPDPTNFLGQGQIMPFVSSASVTNSYKLDLGADNQAELPVIKIDINSLEPGQAGAAIAPLTFKTAGFRVERMVQEDVIAKYKEVYGDTVQACDAIHQHCTPNEATGWGEPDSKNLAHASCVEWKDRGTAYATCKKATFYAIRFIDPCAGEIMDYDTAVRQCRQIVNVAYCKSECEKGKPANPEQGAESIDCDKVCNYEMNPPNQNNITYDPQKGGAWYCRDYGPVDRKPIDPHNQYQQYRFPVIDSIFTFAAQKKKTMGIQPDTGQVVILNNKLVKEETPGRITTTDKPDYKATTKRVIIYRPLGSTGQGINRKEVSSEVSLSDEKTQVTNY